MGQSFFIWNGRDCRSMGITLKGPVPIVRPEERVKHVEIPGRSGDLTETEGEDIYNSYIQTISMTVRGSQNVRNVFRWLRGSGYITFSGEPDRRQAARIIGAITLNRLSRNLDKWTGECQAYCQPLKELLQSRTDTITSSGTVIRNTGDVKEKPRFTMVASAATAYIQVNGRNDNTILMTALTSGHTYILDSEIMEMIDHTASDAHVTKDTVGNFPVFLPGDNTITGYGWSSLALDRRERFL